MTTSSPGLGNLDLSNIECTPPHPVLEGQRLTVQDILELRRSFGNFGNQKLYSHCCYSFTVHQYSNLFLTETERAEKNRKDFISDFPKMAEIGKRFLDEHLLSVRLCSQSRTDSTTLPSAIASAEEALYLFLDLQREILGLRQQSTKIRYEQCRQTTKPGLEKRLRSHLRWAEAHLSNFRYACKQERSIQKIREGARCYRLALIEFEMFDRLVPPVWVLKQHEESKRP